MGAIPAALAAIGTLLQRGNGLSPGTFTTVANVGDIPGPKMSTTVVDVTSQSTAAGTGATWRQKIGTLKDPGKFTVPLYWIPNSAGHQQLLNDFATGVTVPWRVVWPGTGGEYWQCEGFISEWGGESPVAGVIKAMVTFEFTGDPIMPTAGG